MIVATFTIADGRVFRGSRAPVTPREHLPASRYQGRTTPRWADEYGTTVVVVEVLREAGRPLRVRDILQLAGDRLPTKARNARTRHSVVGRDLARELARGDASRVRRVDVGLYEAVNQ